MFNSILCWYDDFYNFYFYILMILYFMIFITFIMIFMTTFLSSIIHEQAQFILTVLGSDVGFWAFVLHVVFDKFSCRVFMTCFSGLGSRALWPQKWVILQSLFDEYNFHPYGNRFFNNNNQKSQVPMLILHGLGLRSNPRMEHSLKTLTVWAGLPAVCTKGHCVSKSIIRLYW